MNISWLLADAYFLPARANGMRFPPTTHASRGAPAGASSRGDCSGVGRGLVLVATVPHFLSVLAALRSVPARESASARRARGEGEGRLVSNTKST
ncbi:Uncharacterised protein [Mycobacteroides abscessus]|nr:Uncharacterised protein [Mycobacteroides abscessus]